MYTKRWRGKLFLAWFAVSSIYVLDFPILMSATAGYLKPSTAGFRTDNATFRTPDSPALRSYYQVNYGALIGLQNGTVVQGTPVYVHFRCKDSLSLTAFQVARCLLEQKAFNAPSSCLKARIVVFNQEC